MLVALVVFFTLGYLFYFIFLRTPVKDGAMPAGRQDGQKPAQPVEKVEMPERLGWALLIVIVGFNFFAYKVNYGLGTGLFNLAVLSAIGILYGQKKIFPFWWVMVIASAVAGLGIGFRANGFVQSINSGVTLFVLLALTLLFVLEKIEWQGLGLISQGLRLIPRSFRQIGLLFSQPQRSESKHGFTLISTIKTTVITFLVVVFFATILSNADPVFAQLIQHIKEEAIGRTLASLVIACAACVLLTIKLTPRDEEIELKFFSFRDVIAPLIGVVILFGIFLFVQARYLFGSHADLPSFNLTYAEYVRKGFQELLVATFFGSLMVYIVSIKQRVLKTVAQVQQLQGLSVALIVELFLVLGSALKRDLMYMEVYGLTRVRIIGGVFLFWLSIALALLAVFTITRKMRESHLLAGLAILSAVVILFLNGVNVDQVIANAQPPRNNAKDYFYINSLSEDAYLAWQPSVAEAQMIFDQVRDNPQPSDAQKETLAKAKLSMIALHEKQIALYKKYGNTDQVKSITQEEFRFSSESSNENEPFVIPKSLNAQRAWQSSIVGEKRAYKLLNDNPALVAQINTMIEQITTYQRLNSVDLYDQEYRFLREYSYPFVDVRLDYYPQSLEGIRTDYQQAHPTPTPSVTPFPTPVITTP